MPEADDGSHCRDVRRKPPPRPQLLSGSCERPFSAVPSRPPPSAWRLWLSTNPRDRPSPRSARVATVEFVTTDVPVLPEQRPVRPMPRSRVDWPTYGFDARRLRAAPGVLRPRFRRVWTFHGRALLEFRPLLRTAACTCRPLTAVSTRSIPRPERPGGDSTPAGVVGLAGGGKRRGLRDVPQPAAELRSAGRRAGRRTIAFDARNGHVRWLRKLPPTESSPLVHGGLVYVGDWSGR